MGLIAKLLGRETVVVDTDPNDLVRVVSPTGEVKAEFPADAVKTVEAAAAPKKAKK